MMSSFIRLAITCVIVFVVSTYGIGCTLRLPKSNPNGDYVVLLHGIFRPTFVMNELELYLSDLGYDVINVDYPSTSYPLEELVDLTHQKISEKLTEDKPVHFVGYSMGGVLTRALLHKHRPEKLGRVVQLAPPNKGSEVADYFKDFWLYKRIFGPAGQQLTTHANMEHLFGPVDYELGVVAGSSSVDYFSSTYLIQGVNDGKVSVESTKVDGMKDHIVLSATHMFFPKNRDVKEQTQHFLKAGQFRH